MPRVNRLVLGSSIGVFTIANIGEFLRPECDDCFSPYGLPFTWFRGNGFAVNGGVVWSGVVLNVLVVGLGAVMLSWVLDRLSARRLRFTKPRSDDQLR